MKIDFYIRFRTHFGQSLHITGNLPSMGNNQTHAALPMQFLNEDFWYASIEVDAHHKNNIQYQYIFKDQGIETMDAEKHREVPMTGRDKIVVDTWNMAADAANVFYTAPFKKVYLKEHKPGKVKKHAYTHVFKVKSPLIAPDERVCLVGNREELRNWDTTDAVMLNKDGEWWTAQVDLSSGSAPIAYKYGIYNEKQKEFVRFEEGDNRSLYLTYQDHQLTILHDNFLRVNYDHWKGAGVSIPVFSLRSKNSFGIGEFDDIKLLADWADKTGIKLIQLLPVNDTTATFTWKDSYPYAAISAFALHPIYINLQLVAGKKDAAIIKGLSRKKKQLNELAEIDYETILNLKIDTLRQLYEVHHNDFLKDEDYLSFFEDNQHWLVPYAAFCTLRDKYGTSEFHKWKTYATFKQKDVDRLCAPKSKQFKEIAFWYYVQYHLHLQLKEAVKHSHKKGVALKGDIPIGIYRYGCDAWMHPELFNFDQQAGAPPDDFAVKGQNWGFPTYNWQQMQADGFNWWQLRFQQMGRYFDAFRIDHILGFFRIWSIPLNSVEGIMGRFVPAMALKETDFEERGIWFEETRLCKPFINDEVLHNIFDDQTDFVKSFFVQPTEQGLYELKESYATQRQIAQYFDKQEASEENKIIRQGLFDLVSNVILFADDEDGFHFRISMENTLSFKLLEEGYKQQLKNLYIHYFYSIQDAGWKEEALKKLPALKNATNMLVCGEDLGMVPHCVPEVMHDLGMLSLEIQRMPKNLSLEFSQPKNAPYLSVVTPSTHDMSTIRSWWEENRYTTQRFFNIALEQHGEAPHFCEPWISTAIIMQHLYSPAMWSIFQWPDLMGMSAELRRSDPLQERINVPALAEYYWRYRMHINLEDLLKETSFNHHVKELITLSGRN